MTVADLKNYHDKWFKAGNATLVVTGDITMAELKPLLEKGLANMPSGSEKKAKVATIDKLEKPKIYIADRPDSAQSVIIGTKMLPEYGFDGELSLQLLNEVLGSSFNSRINMNLREDKGWSYGARSLILGTQSQRPFLVYAPVQTDKTSESLTEMYNEVNDIRGKSPASEDELARSLDKRTLTLPGRWETAGSVEGDILTLVKYGLDESYWDNYVKTLREIGVDDVNASAKTHMNTDEMLWVVVGDRKKIEQKIRDLNLGEVIVVDVEGKPVGD